MHTFKKKKKTHVGIRETILRKKKKTPNPQIYPFQRRSKSIKKQSAN
jgi:hypothetical protein